MKLVPKQALTVLFTFFIPSLSLAENTTHDVIGGRICSETLGTTRIELVAAGQ